MQKWIKFFVGTPKRFLAVVCAIGLVVCMANPGMLRNACERFVQEVSPLISLIIVLGICWLGFRVMFKGFLGGKK